MFGPAQGNTPLIQLPTKMNSLAPVALPAQSNAVKIGRSYHRVAGLSDAVAVWCAFRDRMMEEGLGSSDAPSVTACVDKKLYRISWNGRVWDAGTGSEEMRLIPA